MIISPSIIKNLRLIFLFLLSVNVFSQTSSNLQTEPAVSARVASAVAADGKTYRIGIGDLLDVRVLNHPEMSRKTRVENGGTIRMPYIDNIPAGCLTESQLSENIAERYRKYIKNPQVDVFIEEFVSQPPVAVIGAVEKPGRFELRRKVRLIELLTFAGGPKSDKAGHTLHLIRSNEKDLCAAPGKDGDTIAIDDAAPQLLSFKLKDLLTGSADANLYVNPGDIISLPEAEQIFVTGFVVRPGAFSLNTRITLTQAIGMSGGYMPDADKKKIRLSRQTGENSSATTQLINVEDIQKRKIEDIVLQPNDLIEVPNSTGKTILNGLLRQALPAAASSLPYMILR